jgi:hypothetical protein
VLLAGCGGGEGPHLARSDTAPLVALADKISREGACAQARDIRALSSLRTKLLNAHKVPSALQEPLSSGVNALAALTPPCLPAVPAATVAPPAPSSPADHGKKPKHEKGHGHGKGKD